MRVAFEQVYQDVRAWAQAHGIDVRERRLKPGAAGEFNCVSATMNGDYDPEQRTYYLAHALGSMVLWGLGRPAVQELFDELREARQRREEEPARLEQAIRRYRAFEIESSELAVWLLGDLGHPDAVPSYTNFMRADLEALTEFHRHGRAPVWRDFFARWNAAVAAGRKEALAFQPRPIPPFAPLRIENQEILQEQGGGPS